MQIIKLTFLKKKNKLGLLHADSILYLSALSVIGLVTLGKSYKFFNLFPINKIMKTSSPRIVLMIKLGAYIGHLLQCAAYGVGK